LGSRNADGGGDAITLSLTDPGWTAFVESHPSANPFHHPAWAEVLAGSYGFDASGLALVGEDGGIEAALPVIYLGRRARRRGVSLPFTDWCPPLLAPGADPVKVRERLEHTRRMMGLSSLEVRDRLAPGGGFPAPEGYRHVLALHPDQEALFANLASRTRNTVRRSERKGVSVRRSSTASELLDVFYPLHVSTRRRLGVPVQPRRFFELLGRQYLEAGLGFVVTASVDGNPVASAVFFNWNRRMIYKFSASDRTRGDVGGGQAVVWEAVRWGSQSGHTEFDFGRTELGHEGLRMFKSAWGAEERDLTYTALADRPPRSGDGRALQLLGPVIRNSPEFVSRVIGRLGYRYAA
jgi:CelD/BcsL family acetyltransferase involved in cellulose biosynthesis